MDTQKIDWTQPVETVDGDRVELRCPHQASGGGSIEVLIAGNDESRTYNRDGKHYFGQFPDIRNVAPTTPARNTSQIGEG